jgi:ATP-binding cassette subfamily F protein 3
MRVALAQALFIKPDLLLFDEPTNHLDLPAILWLTKYLRELEDVTLVLVSHDRTFLNAVAQEVIIMRNGKLSYYTGNYDEVRQGRPPEPSMQTHMSRGRERDRGGGVRGHNTCAIWRMRAWC